MFKGIGALIIMFSIFMISFYPLYLSNRRIVLLGDLISDFRYIHNELKTNLSSVPELINYLCEKSGSTTRKSYQIIKYHIMKNGVATFYEYWFNTMNFYNAYLKPDELKALYKIGDILGKYILEEQLLEINNLIQLLDESVIAEKKNYEEKKKCDLAIGASFGTILVILLI